MEAFSEDGRGLAVRVLDAHTGPKFADMQMKQLTKVLITAGGVGETVIRVAWRGDGSIDSANIVSSSTLSKRRNHIASLEQAGYGAMLAVVKTRHVDPESVDGAPMPGEGVIPILFCWDDSPCESDAKTAKQSHSDPMASNPAINLRTAVAGLML